MEAERSHDAQRSADSLPQTQSTKSIRQTQQQAEQDESDSVQSITQQPKSAAGQLARRDIHPEGGLVQRQPMGVEEEQGQAVAQTHHESDREGAPAVRLDMDLDVDVQLKAKIKGDLTLAVLGGDQNGKQGDSG